MNRRDFLRLGAGVPVVVSIPGFVVGAEHGDSTDRAQQPLIPLSDVDAFNYVIGTQTIGATYKFTQESVLVETARAILDMGSNILKIHDGTRLPADDVEGDPGSLPGDDAVLAE